MYIDIVQYYTLMTNINIYHIPYMKIKTDKKKGRVCFHRRANLILPFYAKVTTSFSKNPCIPFIIYNNESITHKKKMIINLIIYTIYFYQRWNQQQTEKRTIHVSINVYISLCMESIIESMRSLLYPNFLIHKMGISAKRGLDVHSSID